MITIQKNGHTFRVDETFYGDYWKSMERSGALAGKGACEKRDLFRRMQIVFPTVVLAERDSECLVAVNFRTQRRVSDQERCFCGSGLPFALCCGRTVGSEELLNGSF